MQITEERCEQINDSLPWQRANVSLTKLEVLGAIR
jgi:hypothetical protein